MKKPLSDKKIGILNLLVTLTAVVRHKALIAFRSSTSEGGGNKIQA